MPPVSVTRAGAGLRPVTQPADDTALRVAGDVARDWLEKAQAFAGPTDGRSPECVMAVVETERAAACSPSP